MLGKMLARAAVVLLGLAAASVRVDGQYDDMDFAGELQQLQAFSFLPGQRQCSVFGETYIDAILQRFAAKTHRISDSSSCFLFSKAKSESQRRNLHTRGALGLLCVR